MQSSILSDDLRIKIQKSNKSTTGFLVSGAVASLCVRGLPRATLVRIALQQQSPSCFNFTRFKHTYKNRFFSDIQIF